MTLNGSFLAPSVALPPPPRSPLRLAVTEGGGQPWTLLAESLQRQIKARSKLTPAQRRNLARDHGVALAALCGVGSDELAEGIGRDSSTVRRIVRRVCTEAGIERGVTWDG